MGGMRGFKRERATHSGEIEMMIVKPKKVYPTVWGNFSEK